MYFFWCSKSEECDDLLHKVEELDVELSMSAKEMVDLQERVDALRRYAQIVTV